MIYLASQQQVCEQDYTHEHLYRESVLHTIKMSATTTTDHSIIETNRQEF